VANAAAHSLHLRGRTVGTMAIVPVPYTAWASTVARAPPPSDSSSYTVAPPLALLAGAACCASKRSHRTTRNEDGVSRSGAQGISKRRCRICAGSKLKLHTMVVAREKVQWVAESNNWAARKRGSMERGKGIVSSWDAAVAGGVFFSFFSLFFL
jgi:hypothetical protein